MFYLTESDEAVLFCNFFILDPNNLLVRKLIQSAENCAARTTGIETSKPSMLSTEKPIKVETRRDTKAKDIVE